MFMMRNDVCDMTMTLAIAKKGTQKKQNTEKEKDTIETNGTIAIGIRLCNQLKIVIKSI